MGSFVHGFSASLVVGVAEGAFDDFHHQLILLYKFLKRVDAKTWLIRKVDWLVGNNKNTYRDCGSNLLDVICGASPHSSVAIKSLLSRRSMLCRIRR